MIPLKLNSRKCKLTHSDRSHEVGEGACEKEKEEKITKWHKEIWGMTYAHYLDFSAGFMVYTCQNLPNCPS